jgi:cyclopropane fatty-acyl-phospholipid synthase-like methyltransferase
MTHDTRIDVVARGYDAIAAEFLSWAKRIEHDPRLEWLETLAALLPSGAHVLELGCGSGDPCTRILSDRSSVTGIDVSRTQLERARVNAPRAELVHGDVTAITFTEASFDAVCSFYVLNHVPRERLPGLFEAIAGWLAPGGWSMHALATNDNPGWTGQWLGVEMFFSGHSPPENRRIVEAAGLTIVQDELVTFTEPEPEPGDVTFQWLLARKTGGPS